MFPSVVNSLVEYLSKIHGEITDTHDNLTKNESLSLEQRYKLQTILGRHLYHLSVARMCLRKALKSDEDTTSPSI